MSDQTTTVGVTLPDMIARAENEGMWLHCAYQDLWFSPAELRAENTNGKFRWGPPNWTLRDPKELINAARQKVIAAQREFDSVCARVAAAERAR